MKKECLCHFKLLLSTFVDISDVKYRRSKIFFSDRAPSVRTCIGTKCFIYVLVIIKDFHVQKVTVHAGVLPSDATALSSLRSHGVVLGERVLRMLISCPVCDRISLTRSVFMFGTIEDTPNIIRTRCNTCYDSLQVYAEGIVKLSMNCASEAARRNTRMYIEFSSGQMSSSEKVRTSIEKLDMIKILTFFFSNTSCLISDML